MNSTYQVIVAGFGTAGANAAIAAASNGASVLVLEPNTYPGGTLTGGGVPGFYGGAAPYGITADINKATTTYMKFHGCTNIEARKAILESLALQAGVDIAYEAVIYEVEMDGNRVTGVRWCQGDSLHETQCEVLIDASADARICMMAGCPVILGRESDGLCNTYTNSMLMGRDTNVFVHNFDAGRLNQYDAHAYSESILASAFRHLPSSAPKDGKSCVVSEDNPDFHAIASADLCGIREGAHVVTECVMTLADTFAGRYDDAQDIIAYAHSNIDIHSNDIPLESRCFQDWMIAASMWGTELWFPVKLGTIIPKGMRGLLVAGRHLGVDHDLGQAVRMNGHVGRVGEAAGILAALAAPLDGDPRRVPFQELSSRMKDIPDPRSANDAVWNLSLEEVRQGLASEKPGFAIWTAYRHAMDVPLKEWLAAAPDASHEKSNIAFALALLDDPAALPELRRLAETRDDSAPATSRKYNHKRGYVAIYLLGRMADADSIPLLSQVLQDQSLPDKYEYHSNALMALFAIAKAHPDTLPRLRPLLESLLNNADWHLMARLKGSQTYIPIEATFKNYIASQLR